MDEIVSINQEGIIEELTCPICFNILEDPVMELPNQHILCKKCLIKSNKINPNSFGPLCPFCKKQIEQLIQPRFIINLLNVVEMKCLSKFQNKECDWKGKAIDYYTHLKNCELFKNSKDEELKNTCKKMREILEKEINPHLKKEHLDIFNSYVKDWNWLENDNRDWKWWWWCDNPWWEKKSCPECNTLWHKYDDEIIIYEKKRISYLKDNE